MKPIEIKPGASQAIELEWGMSIDDVERPRWFITHGDGRRPLKGKYRVLLEYAQEPWTVFVRPRRVLTALSAGFDL